MACEPQQHAPQTNTIATDHSKTAKIIQPKHIAKMVLLRVNFDRRLGQLCSALKISRLRAQPHDGYSFCSSSAENKTPLALYDGLPKHSCYRLTYQGTNPPGYISGICMGFFLGHMDGLVAFVLANRAWFVQPIFVQHAKPYA